MQTKYRKKPVVIEAMQFTYPPTDEFMAWFGQPARMTKARHPDAKAELEVMTLEDGADARAKHVATEGDWIIRGRLDHPRREGGAVPMQARHLRGDLRAGAQGE